VIASRLNLARTTVTRILNNDPSYRASQRTRQMVFSLAQQLGYDFSNLRRIHRRKGERLSVNAEASVRLISDDGQVFDEGVCTVKNVSLAGALIGGLRMAKGVLPLARVKVFLELKSGELSGLLLMGEMARCSYNKEFEIGVSFAGLDSGVAAQLRQVLEDAAGK
jgi:hypothetical protein